MIKRCCDRCGQQIDEGVHAWYVLELHGTDGEFRHKELCEECYEYLCEKDEAPKADRKTENSSEIPNNCEKTDCDTCRYAGECDWEPWQECPYEPKDEPTISKMEQVEDEPMKTTDYCDICKRDMCEICVADATNPYCVPSHYEINYDPKDEPQTCEECEHWGDTEDGCADRHGCKTEPQTDCPWK